MNNNFFHFAVTSDGQRFLLNGGPGPSGSAPLTVIVNWTATLPK